MDRKQLHKQWFPNINKTINNDNKNHNTIYYPQNTTNTLIVIDDWFMTTKFIEELKTWCQNIWHLTRNRKTENNTIQIFNRFKYLGSILYIDGLRTEKSELSKR